MRAGRGNRTQVIVDGILTTNGVTICTGLGATAVVVADPAPVADIAGLIIKAAIPLACALIINIVSRVGDYYLHKRKLQLEAEMKRNSGGVGGGA